MKRAFPRILVWLGSPALASIWLLATRLVWEQTVWTWERGAQMVGFSLVHSGLGGLLLLAAMSSLLWPVAVLIAAVVVKGFGGRRVPLMLGAYALGLVLLALPYGFWQRLFIWKFTPAQSVELFMYAAAGGDMQTVRAFLDHGVDVNAQTQSGSALHAAAVQAQLDVMDFLIAKGADVNALNAYGDSPMANAVQAAHRSTEAQALLTKHGGRMIRGAEDQRDRVIKEQVRRDIERMQADMPK
jgi:hypothetical protein